MVAADQHSEDEATSASELLLAASTGTTCQRRLLRPTASPRHLVLPLVLLVALFGFMLKLDSATESLERNLHVSNMQTKGRTSETVSSLATRPEGNGFGLKWSVTNTAGSALPRKTTTLGGGNSQTLEHDYREGLGIAWLMSFPNSGTSYTTRLVRQTSQSHTATNYGWQNFQHPKKGTGISLPVYEDQPTGPFWVDPTLNPHYVKPTGVVLTKTHCGMRCVQCPPTAYAETTFSFRTQCLTGNQGEKDIHGEMQSELMSYPLTNKLRKAVHLIRNPLDNIVSRFHMERRVSDRAAQFDETKKGFREFCKTMNHMHVQDEKQMHFLPDSLLELLEQVPCRADLIRYIEWHNLAFATIHDLGLQSYVLHYEWYETRFDETVEELLDFLQLERRATPTQFVSGKTYTDYFSPQERRAVGLAMKIMASKTTWPHLEGYFQDVLLDEE